MKEAIELHDEAVSRAALFFSRLTGISGVGFR